MLVSPPSRTLEDQVFVCPIQLGYQQWNFLCSTLASQIGWYTLTQGYNIGGKCTPFSVTITPNKYYSIPTPLLFLASSMTRSANYRPNIRSVLILISRFQLLHTEPMNSIMVISISVCTGVNEGILEVSLEDQHSSSQWAWLVVLTLKSMLRSMIMIVFFTCKCIKIVFFLFLKNYF